MLRRFPNLIRFSNRVARFSAEANPNKDAAAPVVPKETKMQQWGNLFPGLFHTVSSNSSSFQHDFGKYSMPIINILLKMPSVI